MMNKKSLTNPRFYQNLILPLLNKIDPETAHHMAYKILYYLENIPGGLNLLRYCAGYTHTLEDARLNVQFGELSFKHPIILASGWDKKGLCAHSFSALGFSAVEVGSVTLFPQTGNPHPRIFRVSPGVLINRCGFDSIGTDSILNNLKRYAQRYFPLGVSLGKNKEIPLQETPQHFAEIIKRLHNAADYFVINVSSPNTPGLRDLQSRSYLIDILQAIHCQKPLWLKISPDLDLHALDDIIDVALEYRLGGLIATNSTTDPIIKAQYGSDIEKLGGGLSGANEQYRARSTQFCRHIYQQTQGNLPIIGCGGINSADAVLEKITAGASLVQIMTGLIEQGPRLVNNIRRTLLHFMDQENIHHISKCRGEPEYLKRFRSSGL